MPAEQPQGWQVRRPLRFNHRRFEAGEWIAEADIPAGQAQALASGSDPVLHPLAAIPREAAGASSSGGEAAAGKPRMLPPEIAQACREDHEVFFACITAGKLHADPQRSDMDFWTKSSRKPRADTLDSFAAALDLPHDFTAKSRDKLWGRFFVHGGDGAVSVNADAFRAAGIPWPLPFAGEQPGS